MPEGSQLGIQFHTNTAQGMDVNSLRATGFQQELSWAQNLVSLEMLGMGLCEV